MRLFKLIMNCVVAVLLVLSLLTNILICSILGIRDGESFRQLILAKGQVTAQDSDRPVVEEATEVTGPVEEETGPAETVEPTTVTETEVSEIPPIYQDENVKVTYLRQEDNIFGLDYKFLIENTSDRPLTITFSDLYIDVFKVDLSGLYCDNLEIGAKAVKSLTLIQSEWEEFTTSPNRVDFRIKLINPKSLLTIYETSERITFEL